MLSIYRSKDGKLQESGAIAPGTWVRLCDPQPEGIDRVVKECGIARDDLDEALDPDRATSFDDLDDGFMLTINIPLSEPETKYKHTTVPMTIIMTNGYVVTLCTKQIDSFMDYLLKASKAKYIDPAKQNDFVCQLLLDAAELYQKYMKELNHTRHKMVRSIEEKTATPNSQLIDLHEMETTYVYFQAALTDNKDAYGLLKTHMGAEAIASLNPELVEAVETVTDQSIEMASLYRELLQSTRDLFSSVVDNNLNAIMKILTGLTIVLAVPAIVTGFFGMNVEADNFPLASTAYGFTVVFVITLVICLILAWWLHKKNFM